MPFACRLQCILGSRGGGRGGGRGGRGGGRGRGGTRHLREEQPNILSIPHDDGNERRHLAAQLGISSNPSGATYPLAGAALVAGAALYAYKKAKKTTTKEEVPDGTDATEDLA